MSTNSVAHDLTIQDIDILIEAVEAWEDKDVGATIMTELVMSMVADKANPIEMAKMKAEREDRRSDLEQAKRQRKEQSILLRAKLIQMLDARRSAAFAEDVLKKGGAS